MVPFLNSESCFVRYGITVVHARGIGPAFEEGIKLAPIRTAVIDLETINAMTGSRWD